MAYNLWSGKLYPRRIIWVMSPLKSSFNQHIEQRTIVVPLNSDGFSCRIKFPKVQETLFPTHSVLSISPLKINSRTNRKKYRPHTLSDHRHPSSDPSSRQDKGPGVSLTLRVSLSRGLIEKEKVPSGSLCVSLDFV